MGKYDDLTHEQRGFLERLVRDTKHIGSSSYVLASSSNGGSLLPLEARGESLGGVPSAEGFYRGLASRGYLDIGPSSNNSLQVHIAQRTYEYVEYAKRDRFSRWMADLSYDLGEDSTLRSKIIWAIATVIIATLVNLLLQRAGVM